MTRIFPVYVPARTLLLAALEALPALTLLVWLVPAAHGEAWFWLWDELGLLRVGAVALTFFFCMYYHDLYDSQAFRNIRVALARLPDVLGTACLALAALYIAAPAMRLQLAAVLLAIAMLGLGVTAARQVYFLLVRSERLAQNLVVIGDGRLAAALASVFESRPDLSMRLAGIFPDTMKMTVTARSQNHSIAQLGNERIDGLIFTSGQARQWSYPNGECKDQLTVQVLDGESLYENLTGKVWLESLDPLGRQNRRSTTVSLRSTAGARIGSIVFSSLALCVLAPLIAAIALAIWMDSGSPVIFRQQRVGQGGRPFTLYKFRSMKNGDKGPFRPAEKDDRRFTRVGRWLRRVRLDELPQLWNIARGDMSFFGPRPFASEEEWQWAREIPWYTERWKVKPGATGWAQVRRGYCSTREDNMDKLAYDLFYIKNQSFGMNLLILFETAKILFKGRGAR
jgi:exopolysaccharide biosynthesis polyprenyl glycosylphosphotransferase